MEHLALEIFDLAPGTGSQYANLPEDASITITDTSEIFASGDVWSHSFKLNVFANVHILGTAGDIHGSRLHEQINKRRARLWVEGLPLYLGYLKLDDEVDVDENGDVDVSFESGRKTFLQMIEGAKANQVPIPEDIFIGMAIKRERTLNRPYAELSIRKSGKSSIEKLSPHFKLIGEEGLAQMFPKFVTVGQKDTESIWAAQNIDIFTSNPSDFINTDRPYGNGSYYCNTRICYQKKILQPNSNGELEEATEYKYKVSEADRANPSPNFYVLYWFKILMQHLGIIITENQMEDIEDLKRLFFVNTKCAYKEGNIPYREAKRHNNGYTFVNPGESLLLPVCTDTKDKASPFIPIPDKPNENPNDSWSIDITEVEGSFPDCTFLFSELGHEGEPFYWYKAYATSENFPNVEIKEVIEAIENGFGVRMLFSEDYTKVRIVLLRNILRSREIHELSGETISERKTENCIRGFRLTYGGSDEDTAYVYRGFVQAKQKNEGGWVADEDTHDYSQFDTTLHYDKIKNEVGMLNKTCYIDMATGNAYIVKVDKDARSFADKYNPALFECAQWMNAEDGDCTGDEETIKEINIGFTPMTGNRVDSGYAMFVNEEMGVSRSVTGQLPESDKHEVKLIYGGVAKDSAGNLSKNDTSLVEPNDLNSHIGLFEVATTTGYVAKNNSGGDILSAVVDGATIRFRMTGTVKEGYRLHLDDNYKISDELECPLEKPDWGLALGIMRGSGSDSTLDVGPDLIENEDNAYWEIIPGSRSYAHSDSCDDNGNQWDYNGTEPGVGNEVETAYTGYQFGDKLLSDFGCQNQCDLKNNRGPVPSSSTNITNIINSYNDKTKLQILTDQGYYAIACLIQDQSGVSHTVWMSCALGSTLYSYGQMEELIEQLQYWDMPDYVTSESGKNQYRPADVNEILRRDANSGTEYSRIIAVDPIYTIDVLKTVCGYYLSGDQKVRKLADERISLKLRAEKPNPYFNPNLPENNTTNRRYLQITNPSLRNRGLADKFHKEESYLWRNSRIVNKKRIMEIADILSIDKTIRQKVDDVTGFVKKLQYTVNMKTGLGPVDVELWYL